MSVLGSALLPAILAGMVAILATLAIERLGGRIGGLLASLPSTIVPASIGFWWAAPHLSDFQHSMYAVPPGMLVTALFLWTWRVLPARLPQKSLRQRLALMSGISLSIWCLCAALMVTLLPLLSVPLGLLALGLALLQISLGAWVCARNPPAPRGHRAVSRLMLLARGLLAATAIGVSIWIAHLGIPLLAGMASVFPAIFLTTMVGVWLAQGEAVPAGAVGPLMLGSASVSAYALLGSFLFPELGLAWGALSAWILAIGGVSVPAWWWLRSRSQTETDPSAPQN